MAAILGISAFYHDSAAVHPRVYGSSARVLGSMVRDLKLFTLETAVAKLSGYPARRFRIPQRGFVRQDHFADLVVFDPMTIHDPATLADSQRLSVGVEYVLVNGRTIVREGQPVELDANSLPGRSLKCGKTP